MLNVPINAVNCFEKLTGLTISCYIYSPVFSRLSSWRNHKFSQCSLLKESYFAECINFDNVHIVENVWRFPDGCVKTCHGNFSELVMPVVSEGKLLCLLFAGIFHLATECGDLPEIKAVSKITQETRSDIPELSPQALFVCMEALRQLRSRLQLWYVDMHKNEIFQEQLSIKEQILLVMCREATRNLTLKKLASILHLSYSRTSHLIKEATGKSFAELLKQHRLEYACSLLTSTRMSVAEIAAESGFCNAVNFYRIFKREYALSPLEFRQNRRKTQ